MSEIKKPAIPRLDEKPIMGLKSDKNFVTANAVDAILMAPKKKIKPVESFLEKKTYGKVPDYLVNIKKKVEEEYQTVREMQLRSEQEEAQKKSLFNTERF